MVPRTRRVSCADAGNAMQIKANLAAASVRCIMPDIVFLPGFELTDEFSPGWTGSFLQMLVEEAVFCWCFEEWCNDPRAADASSATPAISEYSWSSEPWIAATGRGHSH